MLADSLMVAVIAGASDDDPADNDTTFTAPSGWTSAILYPDDTDGHALQIWYKKAVGGETSFTFNLLSNGSPANTNAVLFIGEYIGYTNWTLSHTDDDTTGSPALQVTTSTTCELIIAARTVDSTSWTNSFTNVTNATSEASPSFGRTQAGSMGQRIVTSAAAYSTSGNLMASFTGS